MILTTAEKQIFAQKDVWQTKTLLQKGFKQLLADWFEKLHGDFIENHFWHGAKIDKKCFHITQGEQLAGFPWHALDYPRIQKQGKMLFIRHLIVYGHGYAPLLVLQGADFAYQFAYLKNEPYAITELNAQQSGTWPWIAMAQGCSNSFRELTKFDPKRIYSFAEGFSEIENFQLWEGIALNFQQKISRLGA